MRVRWAHGTRLAATFAMLVVAICPPSVGQVPPPSPFLPPQNTGPDASARGWAEVITVTDKWLVIQNERGQQFPLAFSAIGQFVVRWPVDPNRISPNALAEATGLNNGGLQMTTDHVDIYEGAARQLVTPTFMATTGTGQIFNPINYILYEQIFGQPYIGVAPTIMQAPETTGPPQIHVVGPVTGLNPMHITGQGNVVTVLPSGNGLDVTQVTMGSPSFVRRGDLVYFVVSSMTPRTLVVPQLILYKQVPLSQFAP